MDTTRASTRAYGPGARGATMSAHEVENGSHDKFVQAVKTSLDSEPVDTAIPKPQDKPAKTPDKFKKRPKVQKRTAVGPWDFVKSVGAGSMGQVKLAVNRNTHQTAAVKIVPKAFTQQGGSESNETRDARVIREAALGKLMYHPGIAQLYEVYSMTSHYYLVFEYVAGGQLLDYIITHGSVPEVQARRFAREIASALDYCHHNSIVHRDLKIENILISNKGDVKIIDFGLSNMFRRDSLLKTFCGSLYFAAPELLNAKPYVGPEIDVWSFGVVLYVLVCGKVPFEDKSMSALHAKIKRGAVEYPQWLTPMCTDLLSRMLVVPPANRASLREVMHHPWMNKGYDKPPNSHIPARRPLELPLDPAVISELASLQFGTEQAIRQELEDILRSHTYKEAVQHWKNNGQHSNFREADPLNSFHPLISTYFLASERLAREGHVSDNAVVHTPTLQLEIPQPNSPDFGSTKPSVQIPIPPPAGKSAPSSPSKAVTPEPPTPPPARASRTRSRTLGSENKPQGLGIEAPGTRYGSPAASGHGKQPSISVQTEFDGNREQHQQLYTPAQDDDKRAGGLSSLFRHISLRKRGSNVDRGSRGESPVSSRRGNRMRSATSAQGAAPVLKVNGNAEGNTSPTKEKQSRTSAHSRAKSMGYAEQRVPPSSNFGQVPGTPSLPEEKEYMPSIIAPKPVFFRGFFSVQSTSNKPLLQIREDIIRVLTDLGIEFVEIKGGFSCIHGHSASNSAGPASPKVQQTSNFGHGRNLSVGTPMASPRRADTTSESYSSSESFEMSGSDMLGHVPSNGHTPVRFEINIVKVPVLALHGVQFKRLGGNAWQYKTIAQEILERLKL